jgi:hypothetical protein
MQTDGDGWRLLSGPKSTLRFLRVQDADRYCILACTCEERIGKRTGYYLLSLFNSKPKRPLTKNQTVRMQGGQDPGLHVLLLSTTFVLHSSAFRYPPLSLFSLLSSGLSFILSSPDNSPTPRPYFCPPLLPNPLLFSSFLCCDRSSLSLIYTSRSIYCSPCRPRAPLPIPPLPRKKTPGLVSRCAKLVFLDIAFL